MTINPEQIQVVANLLHQARFPRYKYGTVKCAGPKICCGQDHEMARALLRRYRLVKRAR